MDNRKEINSALNTTSKLSTFTDLAGNREFYSDYQDIEIQILPDDSIGPAKFKLSKIVNNTYYANPTTIRAMKKNIFTNSNVIEDLVDEVICKCGKNIDKQFWHFCPHCEANF